MALDAQPGADLESRVAALEAALVRERRVTHALREVGNALGTTLDLDQLLELILAHLTELVEADRATLYLLDEAKAELVSRIVVGQKVRSIRLKLGHGIAGTVAQSGTALRIRDAYQDPRFEREWDTLTGYRTTSLLAAPLKNHLGRTIGVLQVLNKRQGAEFTEEDEAMVTALSTQAAVAIDNSRLLLSLIQKNRQLLDTTEQLERRVRDLELLFELEHATAHAPSLEALASAALGLVAKACEARGAALLLADDESGVLTELVLHPAESSDVERIPARRGEGLLAVAMSAGEPVNLPANPRDERYRAVVGRYPFPVESFLGVALDGDDEPLGAIGLFSKHEARAFDNEDAALLRLVSANVSTAVRLHRAREARERSERLTTIGRLLSQVIHDFKTPMTVISGYVQLMQDADDRAARGEHTEQILKQFDLITAMQREVLEFARGETNILLRRVYLSRFFAELTRGLERELDGKPVQLVTQVDTKVVARFDEARVARAIHNLARNAVEAMGDGGGKLGISAGMEADELVIRVSDTGPGIPDEVKDRLFQSFVTSGKQGGTGLGLAIVKKILEEHGGSVRVESSSRGATFELRLPQRRAEDPGSAERGDRGRGVRVRGSALDG
jgi:signal transduction histidine kinase/putative methionine-R-sulfoxide reductase with GAF domain